MTARCKVFLDSDVIISAAISKKGAAQRVATTPDISRYISNISKKEVTIVAKRLEVELSNMKSVVGSCRTTTLKQKLPAIKKNFEKYTTDINDTHIIAGAEKSKAQFLITYNTKHFKSERIKRDLGIIVLTPARLLQYLRSLQ